MILNIKTCLEVHNVLNIRVNGNYTLDVGGNFKVNANRIDLN